MGDSVGVSVSFGKYENDALCWENWSTFSPNNKYLEEVGKCSTPGSVAQKKAFFEAHYKKIAAIKAAAEAEEQLLLLDQQNPKHSTSDTEQQELNEEDCTHINEEQVISATHGSGKLEPVNDGNESMEALESESPITDAQKVQEEEVVLVNKEMHLQVEDVPKPTPLTVNSKLEEAVLVNNESMKLVKQHFHVDLETPEIRPKEKAQNVARKINLNKVEKNSIGVKKKPATSLVPETPASRLSKPKPKPKPNATPTTSLKKASAPSSSLRNMNQSVSESRRNQSVSESRRNQSVSESRHMSLHLSMSMNSVNSDTASSVTSSRRRSLFMEQMGDKDIVKRAFKTFQNRVNQLPSSHTPPKQLPTKRPDQKTSTSMAYQKENERSRKTAEKINPARGQVGPTWKSVSSGSLKGVGVDERRQKAGPTSVALKSNERAERRKEFLKNLEEKSNAREAERNQLSLKSKEVKDSEMKKLNSKAKRVPSLQGVLKSTSDKETMKSGRTR